MDEGMGVPQDEWGRGLACPDRPDCLAAKTVQITSMEGWMEEGRAAELEQADDEKSL